MYSTLKRLNVCRYPLGTGFLSQFARVLFPIAAKLLVGPFQGVWARMKCLSCFGLCSCHFVKSVRATLMTALLLLAFVVAHGESVMLVLLFLARLAVTKASQVT